MRHARHRVAAVRWLPPTAFPRLQSRAGRQGLCARARARPGRPSRPPRAGGGEGRMRRSRGGTHRLLLLRAARRAQRLPARSGASDD